MLRIPSGYAIARLTRDGERCVYIQATLPRLSLFPARITLRHCLCA